MSFISPLLRSQRLCAIFALACLCFPLGGHAFSLGKPKVPDWAMNQIPDTSQVLYGVGSGSSAEAAKQAALQDIAGKLLTQVASETRSHTLASGDSVSEQFSQNIKTSVDDMGLGGYTVDLSEKKGKTYWVRLSLAKSKLFDTTKAQLDPILLEIKNFFSTLDRTSALQVKKSVSHVRSLLDDARSKLFVMKSVRPSYDILSQQQRLSQNEKALSAKVNSLKIYVKASSQLSDLGYKLTNALNQDGMTTTTQASGAGVVTVNLSGNFADSMQMGSKFSAATVRAKTVDELGNLVSERQYQIYGSSSSSHAMARQIAVNKFMDELAIEGAASTLGF